MGVGLVVWSGAGFEERSEEVWTGVGVGVAVLESESDSGAVSCAGAGSGAELVVGGALLLVVATGVGASVPVRVPVSVGVFVSVPVLLSLPVSVVLSVPVFVFVVLSVPELEWDVSVLPVPLDVVFSERPCVVVRGVPPLFVGEFVGELEFEVEFAGEFVGELEPGAGLPVFVPVEVGTPDPFATGTPCEGTGVEVSEVSFCRPVPWADSCVS